jgi:hypothetical protein
MLGLVRSGFAWFGLVMWGYVRLGHVISGYIRLFQDSSDCHAVQVGQVKSG